MTFSPFCLAKSANMMGSLPLPPTIPILAMI
jgi:hypothetical protein